MLLRSRVFAIFHALIQLSGTLQVKGQLQYIIPLYSQDIINQSTPEQFITSNDEIPNSEYIKKNDSDLTFEINKTGLVLHLYKFDMDQNNSSNIQNELNDIIYNYDDSTQERSQQVLMEKQYDIYGYDNLEKVLTDDYPYESSQKNDFQFTSNEQKSSDVSMSTDRNIYIYTFEDPDKVDMIHVPIFNYEENEAKEGELVNQKPHQNSDIFNYKNMEEFEGSDFLPSVQIQKKGKMVNHERLDVEKINDSGNALVQEYNFTHNYVTKDRENITTEIPILDGSLKNMYGKEQDHVPENPTLNKVLHEYIEQARTDSTLQSSNQKYDFALNTENRKRYEKEHTANIPNHKNNVEQIFLELERNAMNPQELLFKNYEIIGGKSNKKTQQSNFIHKVPFYKTNKSATPWPDYSHNFSETTVNKETYESSNPGLKSSQKRKAENPESLMNQTTLEEFYQTPLGQKLYFTILKSLWDGNSLQYSDIVKLMTKELDFPTSIKQQIDSQAEKVTWDSLPESYEDKLRLLNEEKIKKFVQEASNVLSAVCANNESKANCLRLINTLPSNGNYSEIIPYLQAINNYEYHKNRNGPNKILHKTPETIQSTHVTLPQKVASTGIINPKITNTLPQSSTKDDIYLMAKDNLHMLDKLKSFDVSTADSTNFNKNNVKYNPSAHFLVNRTMSNLTKEEEKKVPIHYTQIPVKQVDLNRPDSSRNSKSLNVKNKRPCSCKDLKLHQYYNPYLGTTETAKYILPTQTHELKSYNEIPITKHLHTSKLNYKNDYIPKSYMYPDNFYGGYGKFTQDSPDMHNNYKYSFVDEDREKYLKAWYKNPYTITYDRYLDNNQYYRSNRGAHSDLNDSRMPDDGYHHKIYYNKRQTHNFPMQDINHLKGQYYSEIPTDDKSYNRKYHNIYPRPEGINKKSDHSKYPINKQIPEIDPTWEHKPTLYHDNNRSNNDNEICYCVNTDDLDLSAQKISKSANKYNQFKFLLDLFKTGWPISLEDADS